MLIAPLLPDCSSALCCGIRILDPLPASKGACIFPPSCHYGILLGRRGLVHMASTNYWDCLIPFTLIIVKIQPILFLFLLIVDIILTCLLFRSPWAASSWPVISGLSIFASCMQLDGQFSLANARIRKSYSNVLVFSHRYLPLSLSLSLSLFLSYCHVFWFKFYPFRMATLWYLADLLYLEPMVLSDLIFTFINVIV